MYPPEEREQARVKLEKANIKRDETEKVLSNLWVTKKIKGVKKSVIKK